MSDPEKREGRDEQHDDRVEDLEVPPEESADVKGGRKGANTPDVGDFSIVKVLD